VRAHSGTCASLMRH